MGARAELSDVAAEVGLVGSLLIDSCVPVNYEIRPSDFYDTKLREIFSVIDALRTSGSPVDIVSVGVELQKRKRFDYVGGNSFLMNIVGAVGTSLQADTYASVIAELSARRRMVSLAEKLAKGAYDRSQDVDTLHSEARDWLDEYSPIDVVHGYSSVEMHTDFIETVRTGVMSVPTYIPMVDKKIGGLFAGDLTILAARPGMGKTALATQFARNVAVNGKKVLLVSLEMSRTQLWARIACPLASLDWPNVRAGNVKPEEINDLERASDQLRRKLTNLTVVDDAYTVHKIHQAAIRYKPALVVVDQLPEIVWHDPNESEVKWYGKALKYLRTFVAKKLNTALVVVHQINRGVEQRQDKRPVLSDLRDSGEVEQRADTVLLGYRQDIYNGRAPSQTQVPFELNPAKNRFGSTGDIMVLNYDLKKQWFS